MYVCATVALSWSRLPPHIMMYRPASRVCACIPRPIRHVSNAMCQTSRVKRHVSYDVCTHRPHSNPTHHLKPRMVSASEKRGSLKTVRGKGAGGAAARENARQKAQRHNTARERATTRPDTTRTVKRYINVERSTTSRDIQRQETYNAKRYTTSRFATLDTRRQDALNVKIRQTCPMPGRFRV